MILKSKILLIIGFVLCAFSSNKHTEIEFKNKSLLKVLEKNGIEDFSSLSEIQISDSIIVMHQLHGKYFTINSNVSQYKYIYVGRVNSCRAGGCSIPTKLPENTTSEYFDYFILFDNDINVQLVKVFNYQATHGHEICSKGWLKQFIGHNCTKPLQVEKNIDAISGATISVYAITFDVETKTELLNNILPNI